MHGLEYSYNTCLLFQVLRSGSARSLLSNTCLSLCVSRHNDPGIIDTFLHASTSNITNNLIPMPGKFLYAFRPMLPFLKLIQPTLPLFQSPPPPTFQMSQLYNVSILLQPQHATTAQWLCRALLWCLFRDQILPIFPSKNVFLLFWNLFDAGKARYLFSYKYILMQALLFVVVFLLL